MLNSREIKDLADLLDRCEADLVMVQHNVARVRTALLTAAGVTPTKTSTKKITIDGEPWEKVSHV